MGRVKLADTRINLDTLRVEASVTASVPPAVVAKQAGVTLPGAVELTLKAKGTPEQMEADVRVRIGTAALHLKASGGALPAPQGTASLTLENVNPKDFAIPLAGSLNLALAASGQGDSLATAQADVTLTCRDCTLEAYGPVALDLQASLEGTTGQGESSSKAILGLTLQLAAQSPDLKTMTANLTASLPSLEAVVSALALPPMQAAVDLTSRCEGPFTAPRCTADLSLSNVAVNDIHLERANLEASNDWQGETPTFETSLRVPSIALPGLTVRGVGLNVTGTPSKQEITLSVFHDERNQGRVALSLEPAGPRIHWSQGEGLLGGVFSWTCAGRRCCRPRKDRYVVTVGIAHPRWAFACGGFDRSGRKQRRDSSGGKFGSSSAAEDRRGTGSCRKVVVGKLVTGKPGRSVHHA